MHGNMNVRFVNGMDCTNTQARANPALAFEKYSQFGYNAIVLFM